MVKRSTWIGVLLCIASFGFGCSSSEKRRGQTEASAHGEQALSTPSGSAAGATAGAANPACALLDNPLSRKKLGGALENKLLITCGRAQRSPQAVPSTARTAKAQARALAAAPGTDIGVNNPALDIGGSTQSETSVVAVGNVVCVAWNDSGEGFGSNGFAGFGYSLDGGQTFTDGGPFPAGPTGDLSFGDPSLAYSVRDNAFYFASLSSAGLSMWRSSDSCQSFQYVGVIHSAGGDDKELMAIDNTPGSPFFGRIYVGWTAFGLFNDINVANHSDNGGLSWSAAVAFPGSGSAGQGVYPAVAPNGDVYMALVNRGFSLGDHQDQWIWRSTDGGESWVQRANIGTDQLQPEDDESSIACGRQALTGDIRNLSSPQIVISADPAAPVGYVIHAVYPYDSDGEGPDHSNVFYRRSTDGAATWSPEVRLNDDTTTTDQFYPAIGVGETGILAVSWYDRRLDPAGNLLIDRFLTVSTDGGATWSKNERLSDVSSEVAQTNPNFDGLATCYHGDYDQVAVNGNFAHIVWSDDRRETASGPNPDVYYEQFVVNPRAGRVRALQGAVSCSGNLGFALSDSDLAGTGSHAIVVTTAGGDSENLVLTEDSTRPGNFSGSIAAAAGAATPNDGTLQVSDGVVITATYEDADDGSGNPAVVTAQVRADCAAPVVSNAHVSGLSGDTATVAIDSNEPAVMTVQYGFECTALTQSATSNLAPHPVATLTGLYPGVVYYYAISASDAVGNTTRDDNSGQCYSFKTLDVIASEDFENGLHGYVIDNGPDVGGEGGAGGIFGTGGAFPAGGTFGTGGTFGKGGSFGKGGAMGQGGFFGNGGGIGKGGSSFGSGGAQGGFQNAGGKGAAPGTGGFIGEAGAGGDVGEAGSPGGGSGGFGGAGGAGDSGSFRGLWHLSTACASSLIGHSATHDLHYGLDSSCTFNNGSANRGSATSPVIHLTDARFATLEFNYFLGTEGGGFFDQASVEISVNDGPFQVLSSNFTQLVQPEPDEPPTHRTRTGARPAGRYGLLENTGIWQHASEDLSPVLVGLSQADIRIRFHFDTIDGIANDFAGFYVDDVRVLGTKAPVPCASDSDCNDGRFCTGVETCKQGFCSSGIPVVCTADDGVSCTDAVCDETAKGCVQRANDAKCDDGIFCNGLERCDKTAGCQKGNPVVCPGGEVSCLVGVCQEQLKTCVQFPDDAVCDDGSFCTGKEFCSPTAGCQKGSPPCVDGVDCTDDVCDEATFSCNFPPNNARCDDGLFCTGQEFCDSFQGCRTTGAPCAAGERCDERGNQCIPVCFTDTNTNHQVAGRAYAKKKAYYALGSNDSLGSATTTTSLQGNGNYWRQVPSCPAPPNVDTVNVSVSGTVATVSGTASDPNSDIAKVQVTFWISLYVPVTLDATGTSNYSVSLGLPQGTHAVQVQAIDRAGFVSAINGPYYVQVMPPAPPKIDSLTATVSGSSVTVAGTASDPNNDIQKVEITIVKDGVVVASKVALGSTAFSGTVNGLGAGSYGARAQAVDGSGFVSTFGDPVPFVIAAATTCISDTNSHHRSDGRAVLSHGSYYAVGSNDSLGKNGATVTSLSGSGGYWKRVEACP